MASNTTHILRRKNELSGEIFLLLPEANLKGYHFDVFFVTPLFMINKSYRLFTMKICHGIRTYACIALKVIFAERK
jgi:hypothetical protein